MLGREGSDRVDAHRRVPPGEQTDTNRQRQAVQPNGLFRVDTDQRIVALTLDDGPDPAHTPYVLDLLNRAKAGATFFCVGVNAAFSPELVRRTVGEGHGIGNHTYNHRELQLMTPVQVQREIERGQRALVDIGIVRPDLFRPPKGFTDSIVGVLADADRFQTVFWDLCVERFVNRESVTDGVRSLLNEVRPGSIILAHDGGRIVGSGRPPLSRAKTMEALPMLLRGLHRDGYEVVDVATLLTRTATSLRPGASIVGE